MTDIRLLKDFTIVNFIQPVGLSYLGCVERKNAGFQIANIEKLKIPKDAIAATIKPQGAKELIVIFGTEIYSPEISRKNNNLTKHAIEDFECVLKSTTGREVGIPKEKPQEIIGVNPENNFEQIYPAL